MEAFQHLTHGVAQGADSVVLRLPGDLLDAICRELLSVHGVCGVSFDLTPKSPGMIEWE